MKHSNNKGIWYCQVNKEHIFLKLVNIANIELAKILKEDTKIRLIKYRNEQCSSTKDFYLKIKLDHFTFKYWWEGEAEFFPNTTTFIRKRLKVIQMNDV